MATHEKTGAATVHELHPKKPLPSKLTPTLRKALLEIIESGRTESDLPAAVLIKFPGVAEAAWEKYQERLAEKTAAEKAVAKQADEFLARFTARPEEPKIEPTNAPVIGTISPAVSSTTVVEAKPEQQKQKPLDLVAFKATIKTNYNVSFASWVYETWQKAAALRLFLAEYIKMRQQAHKAKFTPRDENHSNAWYLEELKDEEVQAQAQINGLNDVLVRVHGYQNPRDARASRTDTADLKTELEFDSDYAWVFAPVKSIEVREAELDEDARQVREQMLEEERRAELGRQKATARNEIIAIIIGLIKTTPFFENFHSDGLQKIAENIIKKYGGETVDTMIGNKALGTLEHSENLRRQGLVLEADQKLAEANSFAEAVSISPDGLLELLNEKRAKQEEAKEAAFSNSTVGIVRNKKQEEAERQAIRAAKKGQKSNKKK